MYDAKNAKEEPTLPSDEIFTGAIIDIKDGQVKEFVTSDKWQGDKEGKAIQITIEVMHKEQSHKFEQVFTYTEEEGKTIYRPKSNLGKYKKKYEKLPEVGDQIKCLTNSEGFLKLKLE